MRKISIFKNVRDTSNPFHKSIEYALKRIKEGNSKELVDQIRLLPKDKANQLKQKLPSVCFQGTFKYRNDASIIQHSGFIILDFDNIDNPIAFKNELSKNEYIYAAWVSPSGKGVKALTKIPPEKENHKGYYLAFEKYIDSPDFDASGKDVSRACFESYDPELYLNPDSLIWSEKEEPEIEDIGNSSSEVTIPITSENRIIDNLLEWWKKKYGATKGDRNNNIFKLAAALNDFGVNKRESENVLLRFSQKDFNEREIKTIVKSAYNNVANFGTKAFEDNDTKEKIEKLVRAGKKKSEISKLIPESKEHIEKIKDNLDVDEYWYYDDKNKIRLQPHKYKFWLQQNNFFKYYPSEKSSTYTFIKREQNLLEETNDKRIKDYVLSDIMERPNIGYTPYDFMASNTGYFKSDFLSMIDAIDVEIMEDTKEKSYLYYKNCVVEVSKNEIKEIDYIDLPGHVWKRQIIDRDFKRNDHHNAEFRTFVWKIAGENVNRYNTFKSVIGYLLHGYKNSANNRAIIFNDETISDNPNGGSGKGLFWNALKHMKKVSSIDGKTFEFSKSFPYQTVSTDTQILVFDDVKKNFNFENLFSLITEGITLEYKGQDAVIIPVEKSPKLLITTNYTLGGIGGSHERRKFEVEMSSYFNYKHTPLDEFGHMLFADWDATEWLRFDNYMINCEQYYLKNGLIESEYYNLEARKFIKETSFEFYEWVQDDNLWINKRFSKNDKYEEFVSEYTDLKKWLTKRRFSFWLDSFAKYKDYELLKTKTNGIRQVEFTERTLNNESKALNNEEEDTILF